MAIALRFEAAATAAITILVSATQAAAHHPGGIGNTGSGGPINTISASTLEQGHSAAGISVIYLRLQ